jgi:2-polyprenyl-3-methyl-5-hydroxy-6-metoxy-1,4-benzoquinol methylase/glycosyltransferase involved in cell wall biosynthesis
MIAQNKNPKSPPCIICGCEDTRLQVTTHVVCHCPRCATGFVSPTPDEELLVSPGGYAGGSEWIGEFLARFEREGETLSLLDVGCGDGSRLAMALGRGWKCFGVEPSDAGLASARQRVGTVAFLTDRVEHLIPLVFDVILLLNVLEHCPDPIRLFYALFTRGAIQPRTTVVISTPNADSADSSVSLLDRIGSTRFVSFSAESLKLMLEKLRFNQRAISSPPKLLGEPSPDNLWRDSTEVAAVASGSDFHAFMKERYVPGTWLDISLYEHFPRYILAASLAPQKTVLDLGCGTGYGAAMLARKGAASVVGLDIDPSTIEWAQHAHCEKNLSFSVSADLGEGFASESFDLVTCFEMIEHVSEPVQHATIASIARLLKNDGILLISTPNPVVTKLYGENPFHLRELTEQEFLALLSEHFKHIQLNYQFVHEGTLIAPKSQAAYTNARVESLRGTTERSAAAAFIAVCSNGRLPEIPVSDFVDNADLVGSKVRTEHYINRLQLEHFKVFEATAAARVQLGQMLEQRIEQSEIIKSYAAENEKRSEVIAQLGDKVRQLEERLRSQACESAAKVRRLEEQVAHAILALDEARRLGQSMSSSLSWRLTRPLRVLRDVVGATLKKVKCRANLPLESASVPSNTSIRTNPGLLLESVAGSSKARLETDPGAELLLTIFDEAHYLKQVPSAADSGIAPLEHYRTIGWHEGRDPHLLFDVDWYLSENRDVAEAGAEPLQHYLERGWKEGRNPHRLFDAKRYLVENADVAQAGVEPLTHYCNHGSKEGRNSRPVPLVDEARVTHLATLIGASSFFDVDAYDGTAEALVEGLEPALHYVLVGEERGLKPSPAFDPVYYGERYPDIAACGINRLGHYLEKGRAEGRRAFPIADTITLPLAGIKPDKTTVLILIHEASRTGAPILGWNLARGLSAQNNVVAILMREGPLEEAFAEIAAAVVCAAGNEILDAVEGPRLARRLAEIYRPLYVIANSVETRALVPALTDKGVPVVALVHEFSCYTKPAGTLRLLYERAAEIVFPAEIVRRSSEADYPFLKLRHTHVFPQGPSQVPCSRVLASDPQPAEAERTIKRMLRPEGAMEDLVVVGMGYVDWRKGIDLFIAAATAVLARELAVAVRFAWIGHGFRVADTFVDVSSYLSEQITRSGLGDRFKFMDAVVEVEDIYEEADILFLSSRLDPLPNVSIDAVLRGIPVVCFAEASGVAEILASNDETRELVVPHLDVGAAAALIATLAGDRGKLRQLGDAVRELARARFDMGSYVKVLDGLGRGAAQRSKQEELDAAVILAAGAFDLPLYLGAGAPFVELTAAVREYSALASKLDYSRPSIHGYYNRRPLAGFHPVTYALQSPDYDGRESRDPLANYLRADRPKGPWVHPVLRIEAPKDTARPLAMQDSAALRVVLHGHFRCTDHVGDFLRAFAANAQPCQLILTTTTTDKAAEIRATLRESEAEADIRVVPNQGRDIAPFLTILGETIGSYDLLGHVHGERSLGTKNVDADFGDRWRTFLWQHLIGDKMPMVDVIKQAFIEDPRLGLVFPENPFLFGWEENLLIAQGLAARMGLRPQLPSSIDFPVRTMFWARPKALAPLLRLDLTWDAYPHEPLSPDGTVLHALERLLPLVAEEAGYHHATTYVPRFVL